jgi:hypothetical protein
MFVDAVCPYHSFSCRLLLIHLSWISIRSSLSIIIVVLIKFVRNFYLRVIGKSSRNRYWLAYSLTVPSNAYCRDRCLSTPSASAKCTLLIRILSHTCFTACTPVLFLVMHLLMLRVPACHAQFLCLPHCCRNIATLPTQIANIYRWLIVFAASWHLVSLEDCVYIISGVGITVIVRWHGAARVTWWEARI